jgi:Fe2+ transport system protein FeoA
MKCTLCGLEFSEAEARRPCKSCPVGQACDLVCCPNCGYQTPGEPRWLRRWRRRWHKVQSAEATDPSAAISLVALKPGGDTEILEVHAHDDAVVRKLTALGLLPGVRLRLLRRFPCYLVQISHAHIALDKQLASAILVRVD